MKKRRKSWRANNPLSARKRRREWVGGRFSGRLPQLAEPSDGPGPDLVLWYEPAKSQLVSSVLAEPGSDEAALANCLLEGMENPLQGRPRMPKSVRVAEPAEAELLRPMLTAEIQVRVAPTPELEPIIRDLVENLPDADEVFSHSAGYEASPRHIERLFKAACALHVAQPWDVLQYTQLIQVAVPAYGIEDASLIFSGREGDEQPGLRFFFTYDELVEFLEHECQVADGVREPESLADVGWLEVGFAPGELLHPATRAAIDRNGWPLPVPNVYPFAMQHLGGRHPEPALEEDIEVLTATMEAVAQFISEHHEALLGESSAPLDRKAVRGRYVCAHGLEVRVIANFDDEVDATAVEIGSTAAAAEDAASEIEFRLVNRFIKFAQDRFGERWSRFEELFEYDLSPGSPALGFALPWAVYHFEVDEMPVVAHYLEADGGDLKPEERSWVEAQQRSWVSLWEVRSVEAGQSVDVRDRLSGHSCRVRERMASRSLTVGDVVLARVVEGNGTTTFCGLYPRSLPPREAAEVEERVRSYLRRKRDVPVERLLEFKVGRCIIQRFEEAVIDLDIQRESVVREPHELRNTDDHPFLFAADHFAINAGRTGEVEEKRTSMPGVPAPEPPEVANPIIREVKERHYAGWVDEALPALQGRSPREAVHTADGRRAVHVLLREIEQLEATLEPGARFDVSILRRELGFE